MQNNNNKPWDFPTALAEYQTTYMASRNLAERTRQEYRNDLSQLIDYLITKHLLTHADQVDRTHLEAFLAHLDRLQLKGTTRYRKVMAIKGFFLFLADQGQIASSPAQKLIPPAREQKEPRWLSEQEYKRLLDVVKYHPRDAAIIEVLLQTGIRLSELARLSIQDIELPTKITRDPDNVGTATILSKGRKSRTVGLNYKACLALRAYLNVRPGDAETAHLFLTKYRRPMGKRSIEKAVAKYLELANIKGASVHTMRHTFGTHHVKKGTPLPEVRDIMGHYNISVTSRYLSTAQAERNRSLQANAL